MDLTVLTTVRPGDSLEIHYINSLNEDVILQTNVYDVISENEILIHNPLDKGKIYMIPMGIQVTIFEKRQDLGVIAFRIQLIRREKIGNVYTILARVVSELEKQQRRHFFRIRLYHDIDIFYLRSPLGEPLNYYVFDTEAVDDVVVDLKVALTDISGGGVGITSKVPLPIGTYVYSQLNFLEAPIEIVGSVVRSMPSKKYPGEYDLGISFEDLSNEAIRLITAFVFKKQQLTRRKERIDDQG